jgi:hypothetical protein
MNVLTEIRSFWTPERVVKESGIIGNFHQSGKARKRKGAEMERSRDEKGPKRKEAESKEAERNLAESSIFQTGMWHKINAINERGQNGKRQGDSPMYKWRRHLLKGLVQTAVSVHLRTFGE